MNKLTRAALLLLFFVVAQTDAFAAGSFKCAFKNEVIDGVDSIEMTDNNLIINETVTIPVEESRIRCANFGRQKRFDGQGESMQVVLKTCTSEAAMEGHLIHNKKAAEVFCDKI